MQSREKRKIHASILGNILPLGGRKTPAENLRGQNKEEMTGMRAAMLSKTGSNKRKQFRLFYPSSM